MPMTDVQRIAWAAEYVRIYRGRGYQPLPSDPRPFSEGGRKKPIVKYADYWESIYPGDWFAERPSLNIQVMTGRHWGLAVLDLDGCEAVDEMMTRWRKLPATWTSYHSEQGRTSRHLWFRLSPRMTNERKRARLWGIWDNAANAWKKHTAIELLCDRCLVMAPPSVHPETRNCYGFVRGLSPHDITFPAVLPEWVWDMPNLETPRRPIRPAVAIEPIPKVSRQGRWLDSRHVLDAITDKVAVARSWGLMFGHGGSNGWLYCHDFAREDRNPSAQFHAESGRFWRPGQKTIGLFSLGVEMGHYLDWRECRDALASYYGLTSETKRR